MNSTREVAMSLIGWTAIGLQGFQYKIRENKAGRVRRACWDVLVKETGQSKGKHVFSIIIHGDRFS